MQQIKLGSLFDGSGTAPLAASLLGVRPVWASEVAPFPIQVTHHHFPAMHHLGDISKINGGELEPVHVVVFGSPCQGLQVAGRRQGLADERSGLFLDAVRIIREMQEVTNGEYPKVVIWENVPGALGTTGGDDFRYVLEAFVNLSGRKVSIPKPDRGWYHAGCIMDDDFSLAWRVLDSRGFGVAQQRKRVFLVADLRGRRAGEILFNPGGLPRDFATCGFETAQDSTATASSIRGDGEPISRSLYENHSQDTRYRGPMDFSPMLPAPLGTGGNNTPFVVEEYVPYCMQTGQADASIMLNVAPTLNCDHEQPIVNTPHRRVRRLTPAECARLQGFPGNYCDIPKITEMQADEYAFWLGVRNTDAELRGLKPKDFTAEQMARWYNKLHSDTAEYKMWGNGMVLPCVIYILNATLEVLQETL